MNPFQSALSAAWAELSSAQAKQYYVNCAQRDVQTAIVFIVQFRCFAYALGVTCRQWVNKLKRPVLLLPAETLPHPDKDRELRRQCKAMLTTGDAIPGIEVFEMLPAAEPVKAVKVPKVSKGRPAPKPSPTLGVAGRKRPDTVRGVAIS